MKVGVDVGFYYTKARSGDRQISIPSFVTKVVHSRLSLNGHDRIEIESESGHFLVGDEALRVGQGARQETAQWVGSPEWLTLFYASLSELTTATRFNVDLVIGLPLADYERDKRIVREVLAGNHSFKRNDRAAQRCEVSNVWVVPQAWGALFDLLLDDNGRIIHQEMVQNRYAVLDIGGHTVNYLAVDGLTDIPDESRGTERGAWTVVRAVRDFLDLNYPGLSRLKDHQIMDGIITSVLYDGNDPVDLSPITRPIINSIGQEIVETARLYWGATASTFRQVLIIGGGAYIWQDHIVKAFKHAIVLPEPEMVNARGFAKFASYKGRS